MCIRDRYMGTGQLFHITRKMFKNTVTDPADMRLGSIIEEGIDGDIVLIGFPFDIGAKRLQKQAGQDHGPDCFRRFWPKSGPVYNAEYDLDLTKLKIRDYGNIEVSDANDLEAALEKLGKKVESVRKKGGVSITIGGTQELTYGAVNGLLNTLDK
eukprot:TRINITY_DN6191_c0_g1_i8.p3 TRINITY_DN6191_c0_g1~~TRINITY_DN6191_c0_g1_i8.p3  ORF type:complete len:175 (-),score=32.58 TRINITY_DN6191_c0_g1_i8:876-1340(-)